MFITIDDFKNNLIIPNSNEYTGIENNVIPISKMVEQFLIETIGLENYNTLISYTTNGEINEDAPQLWLDFVNGATYTKDNKLYKWNGIKELLTYVVWLQYFESQNLSGAGVSVDNPKNAQVVSPIPRYIENYNCFIKLYGDACIFNPSIYNLGGIIFKDYYSENSQIVSYIKYLQDKDLKAEYLPNYQYQNRFSI